VGTYSAARGAGAPLRLRTGRDAGAFRPAGLSPVAAWLPVAVLVWYLAGPVLAWPIALLTAGVAASAFRELVQGVGSRDICSIVSTLKPTLGATEQSAAALSPVEVNTLLYSFGLPMLAALILAARQPLRCAAPPGLRRAARLCMGLLAEFLKRVTSTRRRSVAAQTGFGRCKREAIAFAYQFGSRDSPDGRAGRILGADTPPFRRGPFAPATAAATPIRIC